jgi:hypothetical protein
MQHIHALRGQKARCQNVTVDSNTRSANQKSLKLECRAKTACSTVVPINGLEKVSVILIAYG